MLISASGWLQSFDSEVSMTANAKNRVMTYSSCEYEQTRKNGASTNLKAAKDIVYKVM